MIQHNHKILLRDKVEKKKDSAYNKEEVSYSEIYKVGMFQDCPKFAVNYNK